MKNLKVKPVKWMFSAADKKGERVFIYVENDFGVWSINTHQSKDAFYFKNYAKEGESVGIEKAKIVVGLLKKALEFIEKQAK